MRSWLAAVGILSVSGTTLAAPEIQAPSEENPWYQVNLVIFRQPEHLLQSEQWETGDEVDTHLPNQIVSLEQPIDETALEEDSELPRETPTTADLGTDNSLVTLSERSSTTDIKPAQSLAFPAAFAVQEPSDEEFLKALNSLTRSPNYEILYQSTWVQPPLEEQEALSVLVQAGEVHDGFYELEGTTRLHVSRYLHFSGNLWLAKYVQQIEVVKPWWQDSSTPDASLSDSGINSTLNEGFTLELNQPLEFDQAAATPISMGETITRYQSIRTGVMSESRRMRSGELHYLDHPLFGVMVKVIPYVPDHQEPENQQPSQEGDKIATVQ